MRHLYITKGQAALIVLAFAFPVLIGFYHYSNENPYFVKVFISFLLGFFLFMSWYIRSGKKAYLTFAGKRLEGPAWEDGFCLVPGIAMLEEMHANPLYGLEPIGYDEDTQNTEQEGLHHRHDTRDIHYKVNTDTSLFALNVNRLLENMFTMFSPWHGKKRNARRKVGFLIMVFSFLFTAATNGSTSVSSKDESEKNQKKGNSNQVVLLENLKLNQSVPFPPNNLFVVHNGTTWIYTQSVSGVKYYHYTSSSFKIPVIDLNETACVVVPAGRMIGIRTSRKPVYAVNMESTLEYGKLVSAANPVQRFVLSRQGYSAPIYTAEGSWNKLIREWNSVSVDQPLIATALQKEKIPDGRDGGMICVMH